MKRTLIIVAVITCVIVACTKGGTTTNSNNNNEFKEDCSGAAKSFANDVNPIIQTTCATNSSCHGAGSLNGPGPLTTYSQIFTSRNDIRSAVASGLMPQNSVLSNSDKNTILCWIDNGASQN
jgi:hypothetical protein